MAEEKTEEKNKLQSRKFRVWIVWLVLAIVTIVSSTVIMIIIHQVNDLLVTMTEKMLAWFFYISALYLGVNFGQKATFALSDALNKKKSEENNG